MKEKNKNEQKKKETCPLCKVSEVTLEVLKEKDREKKNEEESKEKNGKSTD